MDPIKKILIVDDEVSQLELYKDALIKYFPQISIAKNGEEGLKTFEKKGGFPVVIFDLKMPVLDGLIMARRILQQAIDTQLLMITAHLDDVCAAEAMGLGIFCLPKPVEPMFIWLTANKAWEYYKTKLSLE